MSKAGISYNVGKGEKSIKNLIDQSTFECGDTYILPNKELASKYIAISAYNGSLSLSHLSEIVGVDARKAYKEIIDFCITDGLLNITDEELVITEKGFEHCGAVFSLFYSRY